MYRATSFPGVFPRGVDGAVDPLHFHGGIKCFGLRVVEAYPGAPDRAADPEFRGLVGERLRGVLGAPVGVEYRPGGEGVITARHLQRVDDQVGSQVLGHRVADAGLGVAVDNGGQEQPALPGGDVGDVPDQLHPRPIGGEVAAQQVWDRRGVAGDGRGRPPRPRLAGPQVQLPHQRPDELQAGGHAEAGQLGLELVRALMRELDLRPCQPRPWRPTTTVAGDAATVPDLLCRDFTADRPGVKLVGDITYIPTWQGWLFLATVIDCYTKACIGYAMAEHMRTDLVIDALEMASRNYPLAAGAIFHSDRGTQYTSKAFANKTAELGIRRSVGRTGVCFDNAQAESFNAAVKVERVNRTVYPTREHARKDVARYIEFRYNIGSVCTQLGGEQLVCTVSSWSAPAC